jgi:FixJ family two-component response regulator
MKCRFNTIVQNVCSEARRVQAEAESLAEMRIRIARLPDGFRQLAALLSEGYNDSEVADTLGLSHDQICRRRKRLQDLYV